MLLELVLGKNGISLSIVLACSNVLTQQQSGWLRADAWLVVYHVCFKSSPPMLSNV